MVWRDGRIVGGRWGVVGVAVGGGELRIGEGGRDGL